ncbi:uncharacterized protein METZ01_LOCUS132250 [marine metagenome]|uniref:Uncharacterized protein n=1 Tax=marine metagenome TaxID=408172 RepID=A0A381YQU8_9ZZZZ
MIRRNYPFGQAKQALVDPAKPET